MHPARGIGRLGFRRWYERQLIEAFTFFVTCVLSLIAVVAALEQYSIVSLGWRALLGLALAFAAFFIGVHSLRRFLTLLQRAEAYARGATCVRCASYGRFDVLESGATGADAPGTDREAWMRVKCRKCGSVWTID